MVRFGYNEKTCIQPVRDLRQLLDAQEDLPVTTTSV
jgi:hypothetical protein